MKRQIIVIGADHAGFKIKEHVKILLVKMDYAVEDVGTFSEKNVDYPDSAEKVALAVRQSRHKRGILICGTGIGASIAANKIPGIRAALVRTRKDAKLSKEHNNANILVLGGRVINKHKVKEIIATWLKASFQGQRHLRRVKKITKLEKRRLINKR